MLVEIFSLQYCVLLISSLKYRTEKEDAFSFILYHVLGSQKGKRWLSCARQLITTANSCLLWVQMVPIGGIKKIIYFLPLFLPDSMFSEVWVIKFTDRK